MHLVLVYVKTQVAKELLARGADVDALDNFGRAPFDVACQYGRVAILPELNPVGLYGPLSTAVPKPSDVASQMAHAIYAVAPFGPAVIGHLITSLNRDDSKKTDQERSGQAQLEMQLSNLPAWSLGYRGEFDRIQDGTKLTRVGRFDKLLTKLQANHIDHLEQSPDDGNTALHTVIRSTSTAPQHVSSLRDRVFRELLGKVERNCSPQKGCLETPLHTAILVSETKVAIMLIKAGADLSLRDNLERTALDLAMELEQDDVVAAIRETLGDDAGEEHLEVSEDSIQRHSSS